MPTGAIPTMSTRIWSKRWVMIASLAGMLVGVAGFTFNYAAGLSYLSSDPKACVNCHIMNDQFASWRQGPHHAVATCYDCHLPVTFPEKYVAKSRNGWVHSVGFTFQPASTGSPDEKLFFQEPVRIRPGNSQILQDNCLRCHGNLVDEVVRGSTWSDDAIRCVHCHRGVGHGASS
jgi:cytochrome c nitrite reductase small subunit